MTPAEFDILGLGTIAVDDTLYVERYPLPDEKARIHREGRTFGGQVATALAAARKLGSRCAYGAVLGGENLAAACRAALRAEDIDSRFVRNGTGAGPVHSVIILDESTGTRTLFYDISRVVPVPPAEVSDAMVGAARVLLVDQLGPDTVIEAATRARRLGVPVVMDAEWPDVPRIEEMMRLADHLLVPREFAAALTGLATPELMAAELHRRGLRACTAVTCGREGCYCVLAGGEARHVSAPRVRMLETTGCGDVFHGAFAAALAGGRVVLECLQFASAAAAVFASRPSGWQHLPSAEDAEQLCSQTY